ncbi:hypothetical protein FKP32DRAFT_1599165 [Trametes sanguinea]|nr:hypothetical protein FKP32DRAFT_1599165 [Trametes sanguinea]
MSSPSRTLSSIPQAVAKQANVKKRALTPDSDTEQQHDAKRPKSQNELANGELRNLAKDKKKRRKKKRKLPLVDSHKAPETDEAIEPKASGSRSRSRSMTLAGSSSKSPEPITKPNGDEAVVSTIPRGLSPTLSSSSKGKGRATPDVAAANQASQQQITELEGQVSAKASLVNQHEQLLSTLQQSLSCQICLDLMHRPFALAPCGHSACHQCLVNWFKAPPPDVPANEVLPVWLRKKTCPHCRAVVRDRPVEIWTIKEMVASLVKSGLAQPPVLPPVPDAPAPDAAADIWAGIFRPAPNRNVGIFPDGQPPALLQQLMGLRDEEDGGIYRCIDCHHEIWDGACSECGRVYPGHDPHGHDLDEFDDEDGGGHGHWMHPMDPWDDEDDEDYDEEHDDVAWAGLDWFRQLFDPRNLNRINIPDEDSGDDSTYGEGSLHGEGPINPIHSREGSARIEEVGDAVSDREDGSDEEGYESSFIDDGDDDGAQPALPRIRRRAPPVDFDRDDVIELFDDDEYADEPEPEDEVRFVGYGRRHAPARGRGPMVIASEDEDEEDAGTQYDNSDAEGYDEGDLAAEVAARERELYGDDGSVPHRGAAFDDQRSYYSEVDEASGDEGYDHMDGGVEYYGSDGADEYGSDGGSIDYAW